MSSQQKRVPGKTPPVVFVFMFGFILIIVVIVVALSGGGGGTNILPEGRSNPQMVNDRVVVAMQKEDAQNLFAEISPSLQNMFPLDSFQKAQQASISEFGKVTNVEVIKPINILTDPQWNNQWAQATVRITREKGAKIYIVRYFQENGEWYLMGTIEQ